MTGSRPASLTSYEPTGEFVTESNAVSAAQKQVVIGNRFYVDKKGRVRIRVSRREVAIGWFFIVTLPLSVVAFLGVFAWAVAETDGAWTLGVTIPGALLALLVIWQALDV